MEGTIRMREKCEKLKKDLTDEINAIDADITTAIELTGASLLPALKTIPGIAGNDTAYDIVVTAGQMAYAASYKYVYYASIAFGAVSTSLHASSAILTSTWMIMLLWSSLKQARQRLVMNDLYSSTLSIYIDVDHMTITLITCEICVSMSCIASLGWTRIYHNVERDM